MSIATTMERDPTGRLASPAASWRHRLGNALAALVIVVAAVLLIATTEHRDLRIQPAPDAQVYADAARHLASGDGYITTIREGEVTPIPDGESRPPRYPPGYSIALAPFAAVGEFPGNVQLGAKLYVLAWLVGCSAVAWALGGPLAAALAALALASSPFAQDSAELIMSDALCALLSVAPLVLLHRSPTARSAVLAGAAIGLAFTIRSSAVIALVALLIALPRRRSFRVAALAGAAPFFVAIALFQWATFGNPLRTGYDYWLNMSFADIFSVRHAFNASIITDGSSVIGERLGDQVFWWVSDRRSGGPLANLPNIALYPAALLGLPWVYYPPFVGLMGIAYAVRCRASAVGRYAIITVLLTCLFFVVYFYQAVRFLAPASSILTVMSAAFVGKVAAPWCARSVGRLRSSRTATG